MPIKRRSRNHATFIQPVISAAFICFSFYVWKRSGCFGFSQCSLCQIFTPDSFLNELPVNPSSKDDFSTLMNLNNFTFLMNNLVCNGSDPLLLILVHSDPQNQDKRSTIRNTWGKVQGNDFELLFLLGIPDTPFLQTRLDEENVAHGDLVQGNFLDSYRNLTYKHVMGLKWTKYFCAGARYLLKTDDDVFINSPAFLLHLKLHTPHLNLMLCSPVYNAYVKRSVRSKWKVKFSEYKYRTYPPYCQGFAILYSMDVVLTLYAKAQRAKYFWIDDVFITGILGTACNITPSNFEKFILNHKEFNELLKEESGEYPYLLGPWNLKEENIEKLWEINSRHKINLNLKNIIN